jgi:hypothetical protein
MCSVDRSRNPAQTADTYQRLLELVIYFAACPTESHVFSATMAKLSWHVNYRMLGRAARLTK